MSRHLLTLFSVFSDRHFKIFSKVSFDNNLSVLIDLYYRTFTYASSIIISNYYYYYY